MSELLRQVEQTVKARRLLNRDESILVAVSGGLDSMVLLQVLHRLSPRYDWKLTVAHMNHQLRGRSSQADERLVRATADALGLPVVVERADVRALARAGSLSLEMAAREVRHSFLARAAAERRIPVAALAHHADDQLELFFLRLFRGSGGEGLAGMKWRTVSPASGELALVRPLLDVPKVVLRQFAAEHKIQFREDATNASLDIPRNRIRLELLPLLRLHYQPGLDRAIGRTMDILGAEAEAVVEQARQWLEALARGQVHPAPKFIALPVAVQRRCVQLQLLRLGVLADFEQIEELRLTPERPVTLERAQEPSGGEGDWFAWRDESGRVHVRRRARAGFRAAARTLELDLSPKGGAGEAVFGEVRVRWQIEAKSGVTRPERVECQEVFDADKVGASVTLRHWRPGDRFQPIGMDHASKLQDLFVNQKIPRERRHELLLAATANGEVFWVEGLRIGERFKLTRPTKRRLLWRWERF